MADHRNPGAPRLDRRWRTVLADNAVSLSWSPDAKRLAVALASGPVVIVDATTGKVAQELAGHSFGAAVVSWRPDGSLLVSTGQDGKVRLWDPATSSEAVALDAGAAWAEHASWHPGGELLATAAGKKLRLWSATGELLRDFPPHPSTISAIAWRPGTQEIASSFYGGVRVWSLKGEAPTAQVEWKGPVLSLAWHPGGQALAHGDQGGTAHLWTLRDGEHLEMAGYPLKVRHVSWSPDGRWLATDGSDLVMVWDCKPPGPGGSEPLQLKSHKGAITALAYNGHVSFLASGGEDGKLFLWQPGTFRKPVATSEAGDVVALVQWGPTGRQLAMANESAGLTAYTV